MVRGSQHAVARCFCRAKASNHTWELTVYVHTSPRQIDNPVIEILFSVAQIFVLKEESALQNLLGSTLLFWLYSIASLASPNLSLRKYLQRFHCIQAQQDVF